MQSVKFKNINLVDDLYNLSKGYVITSERYWDGGYSVDATLKEKLEFYSYATIFSDIIKKIIHSFGDNATIGHSICEHNGLFESWKDIKNFDCYNNLLCYINRKQDYKLTANDLDVIDFVVENDFRYFSFIDFYIPEFNFILQPTCHTEVIIYSNDYDNLIPSITEIVNQYENISVKKLDMQ